MIAGTGYNIVNHCCSSCESHNRVLLYQTDNCESDCCKNSNHCSHYDDNLILKITDYQQNRVIKHNKCQINRIATDVPTFFYKSVEIPQVVDVLIKNFIKTFSFTENNFTSIIANSFESQFQVPLYKGREILALISSLII